MNKHTDVAKILSSHGADVSELDISTTTNYDIAMVNPGFQKKINNIKNRFVGTFSKFESSSTNAYALAGISSQTTSTYTIKNDGTYLYRVKSVESTPSLRSNMTEDEKGTWICDIRDTSITLDCEWKRTIEQDLSYKGNFGIINNDDTDDEWESCDNTTSFHLEKFLEEGYRKVR